MIASRKHAPNPTLSKKHSKFNLGGLIKKKMPWKKSIDSLSSSLDELLLEYDHHTETPCFHQGKDTFTSPTPAEQYYSNTYANFTHEKPSRQPSDSLVSCGNLYATSEDEYTNCHTECISLQNSEMTTAMTFDGDDQHSISNAGFLACYLTKPDKEGYIPYDAGLEESAADYRSGGYHPVKLGDKYTSDSNSYRVVHKLGWGHFSTVWLCMSLLTGEYVAMKIVKLGANYSDAARDEINILKTLQEQDEDEIGLSHQSQRATNVVSLLDHFQINGPHGTHLAMVFELMGENLLHLVYNTRVQNLVSGSRQNSLSRALLPMPTMKLILKQILLSVHFMHQKGVIHTDIKPENILLTCKGILPDSLKVFCQKSRFQILPSNPLRACIDHLETANLSIKIADLGNATFSHAHFTNNIQTRQYRAPEILLKSKVWGALADVWSIGCLAFELLTGDYLFDPKDGASFSKDEDHLAQIIELIGDFPSPEYLSNCELLDAYFESPRSMRNIPSLKFWPLKNVLVEKYKLDPNNHDVNLLCDLISKCLRYNLHERYDCSSLLDHPWFRTDARYDQTECESLPNHNRKVVGFTCEE